MECFLCQKHAGKVSQPPGGYIYKDSHWLICHAPGDKGPLGSLFLESQRHFLDFADILPEEAESYGLLLKKIYSELRKLTGAERIYQLIILEGVPHFHAWLIPRMREFPERGMDFLQKDYYCSEPEIQKLVTALREAMRRS